MLALNIVDICFFIFPFPHNSDAWNGVIDL